MKTELATTIRQEITMGHLEQHRRMRLMLSALGKNGNGLISPQTDMHLSQGLRNGWNRYLIDIEFRPLEGVVADIVTMTETERGLTWPEYTACTPLNFPVLLPGTHDESREQFALVFPGNHLSEIGITEIVPDQTLVGIAHNPRW